MAEGDEARGQMSEDGKQTIKKELMPFGNGKVGPKAKNMSIGFKLRPKWQRPYVSALPRWEAANDRERNGPLRAAAGRDEGIGLPHPRGPEARACPTAPPNSARSACCLRQAARETPRLREQMRLTGAAKWFSRARTYFSVSASRKFGLRHPPGLV